MMSDILFVYRLIIRVLDSPKKMAFFYKLLEK
jgi:hypothetical protein